MVEVEENFEEIEEEEKLEKPKRTKILLTVAVITSLLIVGIAYSVTHSHPSNHDTPSVNNGNYVPPPAYTGGRNFTFPYYEEQVYNDITKDYRPRYKHLTDEQYLHIFGDLPKMPNNFFKFLKAYYTGRISDISRLNESYWKQPEFYGFDQKYVDRYYVPENRNPKMWTPRGFGVFPGIAYRQVTAGTTATINFFIHVEPGVETCQILELEPILPDRAYNIIGEVMFNQPANADQYISLSIPTKDTLYTSKIEPHLDPLEKLQPTHGLILLPPTLYWKNGKEYGFPSTYLQKIDLQVKIKPDTPPGKYVIGLNINAPNSRIQEEYFWLFLDATSPDYIPIQEQYFHYAKDLVFGSGEYTSQYYWFELILEVV